MNAAAARYLATRVDDTWLTEVMCDICDTIEGGGTYVLLNMNKQSTVDALRELGYTIREAENSWHYRVSWAKATTSRRNAAGQTVPNTDV